ncbi:hypothetical protein [Sphingosinicella sp. LY1275]|uniref:hypothetical protein n=1 Tax=Sphingosinicella sp. LY1275 TaxID=3095379 RepID=UPI002ADEF9AC|nr:hypothetical protein [Sphingosinicella sp. LY1275]MEA1014782.1 hypothetical protein [Sphingosinicella sp. LY1275]
MTDTFAADEIHPLIVPPQPTGRRLVLFDKDVRPAEAAKALASACRTEDEARSSGFAAGQGWGAGQDVVLLDRFGLAAIGGGVAQASASAATLRAMDEVIDTRLEFWMFTAYGPPWIDSAGSTWGRDAVGLPGSGMTGEGIKLAILDTGIDLGHPDFAGRPIVTQKLRVQAADP